MDHVEGFSTDRLTGERLRAEHLEDLCRLHRDPRVMATLSADGTVPRDVDSQTEKALARNLEHWERHGFGLWLFRDKQDGRFVGRGGLRRITLDEREEVELAYALGSEFWGRGLATEIALASVAIGFERLDLDDLVCFTLTTNLASQRVMQKAGFRYERDMVHVGLRHVLYRLRAVEWRNGAQNQPARVSVRFR